jgi:serine/threonine-protein phosphatase 2A regulatory subunit B
MDILKQVACQIFVQIGNSDYLSDILVIDFLTDKTIKLWKVSERRKRTDGFNLRDDTGIMVDPSNVTSLRVPVFKPMELMVEASPRRVFANAHTYHINSISVNSDGATYLSADDLRINLWHLEKNDQSFSILCVSVSA